VDFIDNGGQLQSNDKETKTRLKSRKVGSNQSKRETQHSQIKELLGQEALCVRNTRIQIIRWTKSEL
jgi:hypothetical protein